MTPQPSALAMIFFHATVLAIAWVVVARWRHPERGRPGAARWLGALATDLGIAAILTYGASLLATIGANVGYLHRLFLGEISGRLMGQALFGEAILVAIGLASRHRRAGRSLRAATLGLCAASLLVVYVDAYRIEPRSLRVRNHVVDDAAGDPAANTIRILHLTDIQTPVIGEHEERALRTGLSYRPDLIVLTGDYVQDAFGRPTEHDAAPCLRSLITRIGFEAPLGVFATEGDVGRPSRGAVPVMPCAVLAAPTT